MLGRNKLYLSGELGQKTFYEVPRNFGAEGRKYIKGTVSLDPINSKTGRKDRLFPCLMPEFRFTPLPCLGQAAVAASDSLAASSTGGAKHVAVTWQTTSNNWLLPNVANNW